MADLGASFWGPVVASAVAGTVAVATRPKAPKPKDMPVMPTADAEQVERARRAQMAEVQSRGGRASTILTDAEDKLGG